VLRSESCGLVRLKTAGRRRPPEVQAVYLSGSEGTVRTESNVGLALSTAGQDPLTRLTTFIIHRRAWKAELEAALGLAVLLERVRKEAVQEEYVELWWRA
jgi:hypothetical protein